ncbi:MAG: short-chain dehydrogenase [Chloroflexi bacterium]|nr:short-chain dehydrogenase [Chloroflexota bacterium]
MAGLFPAPSNSPHALVVGGTGMLWEVSLALAQSGSLVSVIARHRERLRELSQESAKQMGEINPISLDYHHTPQLVTALKDAAQHFGPIELAVIWIHSTAPDAPLTVARLCGTPENPCQYFDILGSTSINPSRAELSQRSQFADLSNIRYHEIILGFVQEAGGARWLTNQEISQGVLQAIEEKRPRFVVGTVEPWSDRP